MLQNIGIGLLVLAVFLYCANLTMYVIRIKNKSHIPSSVPLAGLLFGIPGALLFPGFSLTSRFFVILFFVLIELSACGGLKIISLAKK